MKWVVITIIIAFVLLIVYNKITTIKFENNKAIIVLCNLRSTPKINAPVIFVPGIKGSTLEEGGMVRWLKLFSALKNTPPLLYKYENPIQATGIFTRMSIIPFFLEYRPYYGITKMMACQSDAYVFPYDWRDFPQNNADKFGELVKRVKKETGQNPSVIAHSMGGLIVHGYLKDNPKSLEKVVYVSVPFQPGVGYFDDVHLGVSTGLNKKLLSKEAIFSHPATYLLLPHKGSNKYDGKEFMDAKTWKENKWSVFEEQSVDLKEFQSTLYKITEYHQKLDKKTTITTPLLIINSDCHSTVMTIDGKGVRHYVPGDARVSKEASYPFDHFSHQQEFNSCAKHDKQMNAKEILEKIALFLNESSQN